MTKGEVNIRFALPFFFNPTTMTVYQYISRTNPEGARSVLRKYGYDLKKKHNLEECLKYLVRVEGEPALHDLMMVHPDSEYYRERASVVSIPSVKEAAVSCPNCQRADRMLGVDGSVDSANSQSNSTTLNFMIGGMMVLMAGMVMAFVIKKA